MTVKANVKEDFMKLHGISVSDISGVAIMTDTDNSKLKAISYYQNIYFSKKNYLHLILNKTLKKQLRINKFQKIDDWY